MKWKNKLKAVLASGNGNTNFGMSAKTTLTETDKTQTRSVSSVFVSGQLEHIPEKHTQSTANESQETYACPYCSAQIEMAKNDCISCGKSVINF